VLTQDVVAEGDHEAEGDVFSDIDERPLGGSDGQPKVFGDVFRAQRTPHPPVTFAAKAIARVRQGGADRRIEWCDCATPRGRGGA
jgi:hypothetical protein